MNPDRRQKLEAQLSAYLDGELTGEQVREVEDFLAQDAEARELLEELRATVNMVGSMPRAKAPDDLMEGIRSRMERRALLSEDKPAESAPPRSYRFSGKLAAAAAVVVLSFVAAYMMSSLSDRDVGPAEMGEQYTLVDKEPEKPVKALDDKITGGSGQDYLQGGGELRKLKAKMPEARKSPMPEKGEQALTVTGGAGPEAEGVKALELKQRVMRLPKEPAREVAAKKKPKPLKKKMMLLKDQQAVKDDLAKSERGGGESAETVGLHFGKPQDTKRIRRPEARGKVVEKAKESEGEERVSRRHARDTRSYYRRSTGGERLELTPEKVGGIANDIVELRADLDIKAPGKIRQTAPLLLNGGVYKDYTTITTMPADHIRHYGYYDSNKLNLSREAWFDLEPTTQPECDALIFADRPTSQPVSHEKYGGAAFGSSFGKPSADLRHATRPTSQPAASQPAKDNQNIKCDKSPATRPAK